MNSPIKVSVIIPVYQVENYLERAVDSVLAQTLQEIEIILVDDGSEDASAQICDRYTQEYPDRIRVLHKENEGLGLARNAGVKMATGEYVAFLDSDDTVDPEMYQALYEKAVEADYDLVMCDVQIIYVEENRTSTVVSYPSQEVDLADYIANGNNITYSVNKLFRRRIWEENRYEKMLFEDISLIPALVTRYPNLGYVQKPFYHYYRRAHTLSTTFTGSMVDIVQAFRNFIDTSDPAYREEVVYCVAKQLQWNMTQSRVLFLADFVEFLKAYQKDFLLNPYLAQDAKLKGLLHYLKQETIPENLICVHLGRPLPAWYRDMLRTEFPKANLLEVGENPFPEQPLPENVRRALAEGHTAYAEEYFALSFLCKHGGIVLAPGMRANLNLKKLRLNRIFFGFEGPDSLETGCYGSVPEHYVVQALLATYEGHNIFNQALLPLRDRLRDFLVFHFKLKVNGKKQLLRHEIQIYLPSVLSYDMKDGENCCKKAELEVPDGFELVSSGVLKMWSDQLMENWNLYKQELRRKPQTGKAPPPVGKPQPDTGALALQIQEVVRLYENSTSWRITKPLRALKSWFDRVFRKRRRP